MNKTKIMNLPVDVVRVQGTKDNKNYDFFVLTCNLKGYVFNLQVSSEDKKFFNYLCKQVINK